MKYLTTKDFEATMGIDFAMDLRISLEQRKALNKELIDFLDYWNYDYVMDEDYNTYYVDITTNNLNDLINKVNKLSMNKSHYFYLENEYTTIEYTCKLITSLFNRVARAMENDNLKDYIKKWVNDLVEELDITYKEDLLSVIKDWESGKLTTKQAQKKWLALNEWIWEGE